MSIIKRIKKLEDKANIKEVFILQIDNTIYFNGIEYQEENFYNLYPQYKNNKSIEIK